MIHALAGFPQFSRHHHCSCWRWRFVFQHPLTVIKFFKANSIVQIEIHHQLCQVNGHTWLDGQHISCRSSVIIHPITRTSSPWLPSFVTPQEIPVCWGLAFSGWQGGRDECHSGSNPGYRLLWHRIEKLVPRYDKSLNFRCEYVENSSILAVPVPINLFIKLGFVSVNGSQETYNFQLFYKDYQHSL